MTTQLSPALRRAIRGLLLGGLLAAALGWVLIERFTEQRQRGDASLLPAVRSVDEPPSSEELVVDVRLTPELAASFASLALACLDREYPNKPNNIFDGDDTVRPPRELTPAFFGCFDWHSAVHGHWALLRTLRTQPQLQQAAQIRAVLDAHLEPVVLARELAYFETERNRTFERPYGWAWLLRLAAELERFDDDDARRWREALAPLARFVAGRAADYLGALSTPVRSGVHPNTAFAMIHLLDYATVAGDQALATLIAERGRTF
jgi:hypothetical protein